MSPKTTKAETLQRPLQQDRAWPNDLRIGFHLSIAGGPKAIFSRAGDRQCRAFQIFLSSPRTWAKAPPSQAFVDDFGRLRAEAGNPLIVVHASYLLNLAAAKDEVREKAILGVRQEYLHARAVNADFVVLHMGSHAEKTIGLERMVQGLESALAGVAANKPLLLLENTAGEKNDLGANLEEIRDVQQRLSFPTGVCLDTCHLFQAGYDLSTPEKAADLCQVIEKTFGKNGVRVLHLNDSLKPFAGHHDRHQHIDQGTIGARGMAAFLSWKPFAGIPVILETPEAGGDDSAPDLANLDRLRKAFHLAQG